jgi:hypothetical protein
MKNQDLPILDPLEATILKRLCGEGRVVPIQVGGEECLLSFKSHEETGGEPLHALSLLIGEEAAGITIQFSPQGIFPATIPGGVIPDEPAVLRQAVMALLCRGILDALSSRLSLPVEVVSSFSPNGEGRALSFEVRRSGAGEDSPPEAWGTLLLHEKTLSALLSSAVAWPRTRGPLSGSISIEGRILLATLEIPTGELAGLAPGDVILLGRPGEISPVLRLPDGRSFKCPLPSIGELADSSASQTQEKLPTEIPTDQE